MGEENQGVVVSDDVVRSAASRLLSSGLLGEDARYVSEADLTVVRRIIQSALSSTLAEMRADRSPAS